MKNWISRVFGAAIAVFVFSAAVSAQNDALGAAAGDKYVISAKAGGVNYVSGAVTAIRTEGKSGQVLKGDKLAIGDRISTGADGKAEILLNPGSYLRLGANSVFEFKSTDLDNLEIRLDSGSAMFEVFATEDFTVTVSTPKTKFLLIESGIYRVDVEAAGDGTVSVWKGKAQIGDDEKAVIKSGREGTMAGSQAAIAKFDRDDKDELVLWSKDRAKDLAKITGKLQRDNMRTALMRSFVGRQWNMYSSFGLWVYDPFSRSNCFLPFGYGWGSPYGYWFGHSIWNYNLPRTVFYQQNNNNNGGTATTTTHVKTGRSIDGPVRQPPFVRAQGTSGSTGRDIGSVKSGRAVDSGPMLISDPIRSSGEGRSTGSSSPSGSGTTSDAPVRSIMPTKPGRP